jgi:hypothetical protein
MKLLVGSILITVVLTALIVKGQNIRPDPFDGTWRLNPSKSSIMWDAHPQPKVATPSPQSFGLLSIKSGGVVRDYALEFARAGEPHRKLSYAAKYNDATWQMIQGAGDIISASVTLVKITDHIHYVVARDKDQQFAGVVLHRMAEDGKSFNSVGIGPDGYVHFVRVFDRQ